VIFDNCGHVPKMEHPLRFNRVVEQFLQRAGSLD
jgi:pimeloyl-ACP methyl ester carboxylesterase